MDKKKLLLPPSTVIKGFNKLVRCAISDALDFKNDDRCYSKGAMAVAVISHLAVDFYFPGDFLINICNQQLISMHDGGLKRTKDICLISFLRVVRGGSLPTKKRDRLLPRRQPIKPERITLLVL